MRIIGLSILLPACFLLLWCAFVCSLLTNLLRVYSGHCIPLAIVISSPASVCAPFPCDPTVSEFVLLVLLLRNPCLKQSVFLLFESLLGCRCHPHRTYFTPLTYFTYLVRASLSLLSVSSNTCTPCGTSPTSSSIVRTRPTIFLHVSCFSTLY